MSNHFHIILRTEPQWVASLSDAEVARRWLCVFPGPGGRRGHPPEAQAIEDLCLFRLIVAPEWTRVVTR